MATLTLIATYDVRDDDRRARLAATLQSSTPTQTRCSSSASA